MATKKSSGSTVNVELVSQVGQSLSAASVPALNAYELGKLVCLKTEAREPAAIKLEYKRLIEALANIGLISPIEGLSAFALFGRSNTPPAEVACCIDPFAYVSHLSAMEHHGLTDRFPQILYLTTPPAIEWRNQAEIKMRKELGDIYETYDVSGLPRLTRPKFSTIGRTSVHVQERSHMGAFRIVGVNALRVATIGRVFLDMLREPKLCGGMQHVLDIYEKEAKRYLRLIVDEVERHGKPIDKVRAGYVLAEVCKLDSPALEGWKIWAQRGGSRKLDPDAEYASTYSDVWKLSINVPSLTVADEDIDEF